MALNDVRANEDYATTIKDTPLIIDALANDDLFGESPVVLINDPPAHGKVVVNADSTLSYLPEFGFIGEDVLAYQIGDSIGRIEITVDDAVSEVVGGLDQTEVSELYVAIFGRASEGEGNRFWQQLDKMDVAAEQMLATDAAKEYFGSAMDSNFDFIEHIYENTLGKGFAEDPNGINFWVDALDNGMGRGDIVASLVNAATDEQYKGLEAQDVFLNKVAISNFTAGTIEQATMDNLQRFVDYAQMQAADLAVISEAQKAVVADVMSGMYNSFGDIMRYSYSHEIAPVFKALDMSVNAAQASRTSLHGFLNSEFASVKDVLTGNEDLAENEMNSFDPIIHAQGYTADETFLGYINELVGRENKIYASHISNAKQIDAVLNDIINVPRSLFYGDAANLLAHLQDAGDELEVLISKQENIDDAYADLASIFLHDTNNRLFTLGETTEDDDHFEGYMNDVASELAERMYSDTKNINERFDNVETLVVEKLTEMTDDLALYGVMPAIDFSFA